MKKQKPYYPNNWEAISNAPDECFETLPFEQFMDWKIAGWELPSSIDCIIREHNLETGKITEHVYRKTSAAKKKVNKIMDECTSEFVLASHDSIHHLYPKEVTEPYEDHEEEVNREDYK